MKPSKLVNWPKSFTIDGPKPRFKTKFSNLDHNNNHHLHLSCLAVTSNEVKSMKLNILKGTINFSGTTSHILFQSPHERLFDIHVHLWSIQELALSLTGQIFYVYNMERILKKIGNDVRMMKRFSSFQLSIFIQLQYFFLGSYFYELRGIKSLAVALSDCQHSLFVVRFTLLFFFLLFVVLSGSMCLYLVSITLINGTWGAQSPCLFFKKKYILSPQLLFL